MKIILGASTRAGARSRRWWCRRLQVLVSACRDVRSYWIPEGKEGELEKKEKARQKEEGRQVDRFCLRSRSCVGIEETDNLSLFDKLWVPPPPPPSPPFSLFVAFSSFLSSSSFSFSFSLPLRLLFCFCFSSTAGPTESHLQVRTRLLSETYRLV